MSPREILSIIAMFGSVVALAAGCLIQGYKKGYGHGFHDAFQRQFDSDSWWAEQEAAIDEERVKIWREEGIGND
jgi:hypothetical protein